MRSLNMILNIWTAYVLVLTMALSKADVEKYIRKIEGHLNSPHEVHFGGAKMFISALYTWMNY